MIRNVALFFDRGTRGVIEAERLMLASSVWLAISVRPVSFGDERRTVPPLPLLPNRRAANGRRASSSSGRGALHRPPRLTTTLSVSPSKRRVSSGAWSDAARLGPDHACTLKM